MKTFFTIEETANLAEVNLLDLTDWVESGKVKASTPLELLIAGAPVGIAIPARTLIDNEQPAYFTREKIREIRSLKTKEKTTKPATATTVTVWDVNADPNTIYTPEDLAIPWKWSVAKIRRMFEKEDGVRKDTKPNQKKRRYVTLRIPHSVALRVWRKLDR
jgi:hypothetical protein